jgi:hypothetical protein
MKSKFNLTIALLLFSTLLVSAAGAEYNKQYRKGWTKSSVTALKITNKFGEVKINDMGGDSVTIKVVITIDNASENKAKELMNRIHINFEKTGNMVIAETEIEESFRNNQSFSIDYLVNIPKDRELGIVNRYGNVIIADLEAKGSFDVDYGSFTAGNVKVPAGNQLLLQVSYGKANIESVNDAKVDIKYSKLYADKIGNLQIVTKYSGIEIGQCESAKMDSKYDAVSLDQVASLKSVSRYTNYKIGTLSRSLDLDSGYGSVKVEKVDPKFDQIRIVSSYGGISIGLNDANYRLKADCDYCDINYPADRYKGNKIKENHRMNVDGAVGTGGGTVSISSRYGGIKLW